ncbi:MAG: DUF86 domain-containing protein [Actinobacteria bacterium]|jgi:uncharacterized protein with HEPN domain|nr:DUF86 domain-containing protein [Actinomycetota bacterium]
MRRSDEELVADALMHLCVLRKHLARGDLDDQTVADAVTPRLAAAIEALASGTDELRTRAFGDDWPLMWATRNRIAHGYAYIDMSIVTATVQQDLPWLEDRLREEATRFARE